MDNTLKKIIETSTFEIISGKFLYTKVKSAPDINNHFLISKDKDEITVVTEQKNVDELDLFEKNKDLWALIALNVSAPFYSVGFLAIITNAIGKQGKDVLVVSTYSKDYILVQYDFLEGAKKVLLALGFKEKVN